MSNFDNCIPFVLNNEGGLLQDPTTGENSNFGVTDIVLKANNWYPKDPKDLTLDGAKNVYYIFFWQKYNLSSIQSENMAAKVFDMIVNMGPRQAAFIVQKALGFAPSHIDGMIGTFTIADLNQWTDTTIMPKIVEESTKFYRSIAIGPKEKYLNGWLVRAAKVPSISSSQS